MSAVSANEVMAVQADVAAHSNPRRGRFFEGTVTFTTSGAVSTTELPSETTFVKPTGTGLYRLTVPKGNRITVCGLTYMDASGGADTVTCKSATASTGVIDLTTTASGSAANATSGDSLHFCVYVEL